MKPIASVLFVSILTVPGFAQKKPAPPVGKPGTGQLGQIKLLWSDGTVDAERRANNGVTVTLLARKGGQPVTMTMPGRELRGRKIVAQLSAKYALDTATVDGDVYLHLEQEETARPQRLTVTCDHARIKSVPKPGVSRIDFSGNRVNVTSIYAPDLPPIEMVTTAGWIELEDLSKPELGWKLHLEGGQAETKKEPS